MKYQALWIALAFLLLCSAMSMAQQRSSEADAPQTPSSSSMSSGGRKGNDDVDYLPAPRRIQDAGRNQCAPEQTGFDKNFPPPGVEVVSWYVMMGVGQVVTLRLPPDKLREVNLAIEHGAWGAFRTEFYPTYDYKPIWEAQQKQTRK